MYKKLCFNFPHEVVENLSILSNTRNGLIIFWNKYQIFVINLLDLESSETRQLNWKFVGNTNFIINHIILLNNYLLCLGNEREIKIKCLNKIQHCSPPIEEEFDILDHNILCISWCDDFLYSIKFEKNELYLRIYNIHPKVQFHSQYVVVRKILHISTELNMEKCKLYSFMINENQFVRVNQLFGKERKEHSNQIVIVIVTFENLTLYALLVDLQKGGRLTPIKLLTCPSEINNVGIIEEDFLHLVICLNSGTVIQLPLVRDFKLPNIKHLNTAIYKFFLSEDKIVYTDGGTMWVSSNILSQTDVTFRQLFVKCIKDFTNVDTKVICTTYSKQVYIFNLDDESSFMKPLVTSEYCSAEYLLNNVKYLDRIMEEVEKNNVIIKNIQSEENYITTLALSNRLDIMNELIQYNIKVYETYTDVLTEGLILNLTNDIRDYFNKDAFSIVIKMSTAATSYNFIDALSNIFTGLQIHITLISEQKIIKTVTIKVLEQLKTVNIVIPLSMSKCCITDLSVDIKLVKKIPKVLDKQHNLWTSLHCKQFFLSPEQFIKTEKTSNNIQLLKEPEDSIDNLLLKHAIIHHKNFIKIDTPINDALTWPFYVKLPKVYMKLFQNETFYKEQFNSIKARNLLQELSSKEFLKSNRNISFYIKNEKFSIDIIADDLSEFLTLNMLRVSCANPLLGLSIRNFFSNLIHNNFQRYKPGTHDFSCGVMNLEKEIWNIDKRVQETEKYMKNCINDQWEFEKFYTIYEHYQKNVIAFLV